VPTETTLVSAWLSTASEFEPDKYLEKISELSGQPVEEILGERRWPRLIKPRRLYWACLRHIGKWSYPEIGESVGRDHTTVMHGITHVPYEVVQEIEKIVKG
jgi:chromosomal replication initiation ATPase DnaA